VTAVAQFCGWCRDNGLQLSTIRPLHVSAYIEMNSQFLTAPSVKQHLAALRVLFNWLVIKQVVPDNPAMFVKGPKLSRQVGITPIMESEQVRQVLDSIPVVRKVKAARKHGGGYKEEADIKGLRDRAAIGIMAYTFGRVSAIVGLRLGDYRLEGKRTRLRLMEKDNEEKLVWLHREAEEHLAAYLSAAHIEDHSAPIFQTVDKTHHLSGDAMSRRDMLRVVKQRCRASGFRLIFATIHSAVQGLPYSSTTVGRSKQRRTWQTIPTLAPPNFMTGVKIWPRSARSSGVSHSKEKRSRSLAVSSKSCTMKLRFASSRSTNQGENHDLALNVQTRR
jgi:site-specific recombinase XerD